MIVLIKILKKLTSVLKERKVFAYSALYILLLWTFSSLLFHKVEGVSLFDSLYWVITTTTTVGYGDITPKTEIGKVLSIFVMISGIGVLGVMLASMAEIMIEKGLKRRPRVFMEDHVIALGWNGVIEVAVKELLKEGIEVAVVADVESIPIEHENLVFINGDITDEEILKRAGVEKAAFSIISGKTDNETLLSAIAVKKMNENIRIACVVSDPKVKRALEMLGVEQTISSNEFSGLFLCRFVFAPRISSVFSELMSTEGMDIFENKISGSMGKTFEEVMLEMKEKRDAIVLGVVRGNKVMLNPEKSLRITEGDEIIYIAKNRITEL